MREIYKYIYVYTLDVYTHIHREIINLSMYNFPGIICIRNWEIIYVCINNRGIEIYIYIRGIYISNNILQCKINSDFFSFIRSGSVLPQQKSLAMLSFLDEA